MTLKGCSRDGKRINPRPREQTGSDNASDASCGLPMPNVLQLNIEGLTPSKICVVRQLAARDKALVILLQETHTIQADRLVIPNYTLAGSVLSRKHGLATFVQDNISWSLLDRSRDRSDVEWLCVDIDGIKIINVYKPPTTRWLPSVIPMFSHPCLYAGDFNCQHTD